MKYALTASLVLLSSLALARETPEPHPLTKPGDVFVSLSAHACLGRCPVFELYVFEDGHVVFRGTQFTAKQGVVYRNSSRATYRRLRDLLEERHALGERPECTEGYMTDFPGVTVIAQDAAGRKDGYWYFGSGCKEEVDMGSQLYDSFVIETNTAALIDSDTREWQRKSRASQAGK